MIGRRWKVTYGVLNLSALIYSVQVCIDDNTFLLHGNICIFSTYYIACCILCVKEEHVNKCFRVRLSLLPIDIAYLLNLQLPSLFWHSMISAKFNHLSLFVLATNRFTTSLSIPRLSCDN